ncbi:50S ribosomal protein L32 [Candidatus Falkowbacteria bacterium CG10_big_fil_rev_8_21_14_0_10_43_10]|uniref:Large ribosomal subunit protein bL32 n=1 Tax=Candidatus Falkowbacteria bacterium CG10_big_fil_rev_8_21_14_0_10_43_10 TaxID=1974567 RepID=A0A2H0V2G9_9BACT|nr:MAG: 50S ribosomal protein L32 [Candidatus Falkowbacteria bacterium CG10_big_fil_rev_8_21_14_0_10_43_10]
MSVPKKRRTRGSVKRRQSHHALKKQKLAKCKQCGKAVLSHAACSYCGYYKGKEVIKVKSVSDKKKK